MSAGATVCPDCGVLSTLDSPDCARSGKTRRVGVPSLEELAALYKPLATTAILPTGYDERKALPIATGVIDYFPKALAAVAHCSKVGNDQHNPGEPLHWAREKSTDEANTLIRHFLERGTVDSDGVRHSAKVAWRALALLEKEIEADAAKSPGPYSDKAAK